MTWGVDEVVEHLLAASWDEDVVPSGALLRAAREVANELEAAEAVVDTDIYVDGGDLPPWDIARHVAGTQQDSDEGLQAARDAIFIELLGLARLRDDLHAQITFTSALARAAGLSWGHIGNALGVTQQAAHKHSAGVAELHELQSNDDLRDWADRARQRRTRS